MPRVIKYVGYPSHYYGKHLLKILTNLKDFGIGRVVTRGIYKRYERPTFYVIRKVEPAMDDENIWGKVWVDEYFQGIKAGYKLLEQSHLPDFRLVHKSDEKSYFDQVVENPPVKILPRDKAFPPVLKMVVERDLRARGAAASSEGSATGGEGASAEPRLPLVYRDSALPLRRVAAEGETPDFSADDPEPIVYDKFRVGIHK